MTSFLNFIVIGVISDFRSRSFNFRFEWFCHRIRSQLRGKNTCISVRWRVGKGYDKTARNAKSWNTVEMLWFEWIFGVFLKNSWFEGWCVGLESHKLWGCISCAVVWSFGWWLCISKQQAKRYSKNGFVGINGISMGWFPYTVERACYKYLSVAIHGASWSYIHAA